MNATRSHEGLALNSSLTEVPRQPLERFRFQIYRQMRAGYFSRSFEVDSPVDAVKVFLLTAPAFEGGSIRLWDRQQERLLASVEWNVEQTRMGFNVRARTNVFHDVAAAEIAQQIAERETLEETVTQRLQVTA